MDIRDDNIKFVEEHITIRFNPFIYAFSTNTIPNYLKVGDTFRGVDTRICEWQKILAQKLYPQIVRLTEEYRHKALLSDEIYFRDYSVHEYLEALGKHRIKDEQIRKLYSQEFFEDTSVSDIEAAIKAITEDFESGELNKKYVYYSVSDNKSATIHGDNSKEWKLRPNQETVVENFLNRGDQRELLMYAVMRFGKSFTAMYCAKEAKARKILVASAKADVAGEWQKTVETPKCFKGFKFVCDDDFKKGFDIEQELAASEENRIVVFLTLQNLTGKDKDGKNIKKKLQQVFNTVFDLIIVDETHYGAWANSYGAPLKDADDDIIKSERKEYETFGENVAKLHYKQKLHLSGTPYNLLYDNKFNEENIIATCQFKDILHDKAKWDEFYFNDIENGVINPDTGKPYQEYDNPYFGFPNMLRFAFNLPEETRQRLTKIKSAWTLNDLFETKIENGTPQFIHEQEVLELLKAIDGSKQVDGILGFLDIPKIKDNDVCKHMVFVLPRKYACDAMANLLNTRCTEFVNLSRYTVLNITGHNMPSELDSVDKVKAKIAELEKNGQKSITLTVYKMLTGVTVKEWDTMVMLKNTSSAQEYDQAIFRIQNQYVEEYSAPNGDTIKIDKKPQTILVDFDPVRMFTLHGLSAKIVNSVSRSAGSLDDAIADELKFFPIITYNAEKLVKVEPTDLIKLITQYSNNKSIVDSVQSVVLDKNILADADIKAYISSQSATSAKNDLDVVAHQSGEQSDVDIWDEDDETDIVSNGTGNHETSNDRNDTEDKNLEKKFRMCVARLSFYAFLSKSKIENLQDINDSLKNTCAEYERNKRIFNHLQLNIRFVRKLINSMSRYYAGLVNDALKRADLLSRDDSLDPKERALNAIRNFNRFSDSEIVTPHNICTDMINCIGKDELAQILDRGDKILDIASKTGEFAFALYDLLHDAVDEQTLCNGIYSIPTSGTAYEFTRHIYEVLGLNIENIATFYAEQMIEIKDGSGKVDYDKLVSLITQKKPFNTITLNDTVTEGEEKVKFEAIVGNPPYQEKDGGAQASARPIYQEFVNTAKRSAATYISLITPSRWFAGGKGLDEFREQMLNDAHIQVLHDYLHPEDLFPGTNNRGGICYFFRNSLYDNAQSLVSIFTHETKDKTYSSIRTFKTVGFDDIFIRDERSISILNKIKNLGDEFIENNISPRKPFGIESNIVRSAKFHKNKEDLINPIKCYGKGKKIGYIEKELVTTHSEWLSLWKVYMPRANNIGTELSDDNLNTFIGEPNSVCTEAYTFIGIGLNLNSSSAKNLAKYFNTRFMRYLHSLAKASHDATSKTFRFVPLQDFTENSDIDWSKSIPEIDEQLYTKYNLSPDEIAFIEKMIKPME